MYMNHIIQYMWDILNMMCWYMYVHLFTVSHTCWCTWILNVRFCPRTAIGHDSSFLSAVQLTQHGRT